MDSKIIRNLLVLGTAAATCATLTTGCAGKSSAPFHMYDSPLLEGRVESRYPRARDYDPLELGDHTPPTEMYATDNADAPKAPKRASKPQRPSLSAQRKARPTAQGAPTAKGAPAAKSDAGASGDDAEELPVEAAGLDDSQPALAADYVWSVYDLNAVTFSAKARRSVPTLFRECRERGKIYHSSRPNIGDVVFFHNTDDYNEDGRNNDWYTDVALVESVDDGGQVRLLGYRDGAVRAFQMNLEQPNAARTRHGEVSNSQLRPKRADDPPFTQYLAGQLFAGTCAALGDEAEMVVIDNWQPGMDLRN